MKKKVIKTAFIAICVVAASLGGFKAYHVTNLSKTDLLLAENVEALSSGENNGVSDQIMCEWVLNNSCKPLNFHNCWANYNGTTCGRAHHWFQPIYGY